MTMLVPGLLVVHVCENGASPGERLPAARSKRSSRQRWRRALARWRSGRDELPAVHGVLLEHVEWHAAAAVCADALRGWWTAGSRERDAAYLAYRAALEREEAAARELARAQRRTA